jgi:hypothetical protein
MQDDQQDAVDMLMAEVDVYELFFFKHCKGRRVQLALCEGIQFSVPYMLFHMSIFPLHSEDKLTLFTILAIC